MDLLGEISDINISEPHSLQLQQGAKIEEVWGFYNWSIELYNNLSSTISTLSSYFATLIPR